MPDARDTVLQRINQLRRKPKKMKRKTFVEVATIMNNENIMTLTGKTWTGASVQNFVSRYK